MNTYDKTDASEAQQEPQADFIDENRPLPLVSNTKKGDLSTLKPALRRVNILAIVAALIAGGAILYSFSRWGSAPQSASPTPAASIPEPKLVTALGRLEPHQEVIKLSAPVSPEGSRVEQLLVKEGDKVRSQQVVAILDSQGRLLTALDQAKEQVNVARSRLAQVQAGAKAGEINAQTATIARVEAEQQGEISAQAATVARLEAELRNARTESQRYQQLYRDGAISASSRDTKRLSVDTFQQQLNEARANLNRTTASKRQQLNEAKATLNRIAEVRPVDVQAAQADVSSAIAAVKRAQANLDLAYVRASRDGQILKIHTWPGAVIGNDGIVELGKTDQMYVVAEVYESDIGKVRLGQRAAIASSAFTKEVQGTVEQIGLQIRKKDVLNTDPTANTDARVVEVKIRLDPEGSQKVSGLTNLQVKVAIDLQS